MKHKLWCIALSMALLLLPLSACAPQEPTASGKPTSAGTAESDKSTYDSGSDQTQPGDATGNGTGTAAPPSGGKGPSSQQTNKVTSKATSKPGPKPSNNLVVSDAGKDPNARYDIKGEVTVAIDTARATDYQALFDQFSSVYPNIKLKFQYFQHKDTGGSNEDNAMEYLTSCAATKTMPDVVFDDAGFMPFYLSQGWVHPLDSFVKNDSDFNYIPQNLIDSFTFGKKLYALPGSLHFNGVYVNADLLDELNMKMPALGWTMSEMATYLRKATTEKYGGTNAISDMQVLHYSGIFGTGTDSTTLGYNYKTRSFGDMSGLRKAVNYVKQLNQVPGLVTSKMSADDFASKFGSANVSVIERGLVLLRLGVGTWILNTDNSSVSYKRVLWSPPQEQKGRMGMHVDFSFMTSTAKNPEAAYQVLRYITYSTEGNLARLSMYDKANSGKYELKSPYYIPATKNPKVKEKFVTLPSIGDYEKYCYDNMQNSFRVDPEKFVPNWLDMFNGMFVPEIGKVMSGASDLDSTIANLQKSMTSYLNGKWKTFDDKLKTIQADFDKTHK